jgi:hypothetical protein
MRNCLGRLLLALFFSLLLGLAIGTWLRLRLEQPVYYIGGADLSGAGPFEGTEIPTPGKGAVG